MASRTRIIVLSVVLFALLSIWVIFATPIYGIWSALQPIVLILAVVLGFVFVLSSKHPIARAINLGLGLLFIVGVFACPILMVYVLVQNPSDAIVAVPLVLVTLGFAVYFFVVFILGILLLALKKLPEAEMYYTYLLRWYPRYSTGYVNRGSVREALGNHEGALSDYRQALEIVDSEHPSTTFLFITVTPNDLILYTQYAILLYVSGNFGGAIDVCTKGLKRVGDDITVKWSLYSLRVGASISMREFLPAMSDIDTMKAIALKPHLRDQGMNSLDVYKSLALYGSGQEAEARELWRKVVMKNPQYNDENILRSWKWSQTMLDIAKNLRQT